MALILKNLVKRFLGPDGSAVPVIDIPELRVDDGEQVALIGSSGSGKTTLLHLIAGILTPDSGQIIFEFGGDAHSQPAPPGGVLPYYAGGHSVDITWLGEAQRDVFRGAHIGYVFQTHHLLSGLTAMENVLLGMSFTGRPADAGWAEHLLKAVGLAERLNYRPAKLSVGQQQRVAVARALANRPRLVLADEPTGALDSKNAKQVLELIRSLCGEVKASLLLVTHDLDVARQLPRSVSLSDVASGTAQAEKAS
jgi:putative ABC transport system ATP-binding protein